MIIKYQDTIPPLTDEEFRQLEQNILADGIRDPLTVWGDVLIDGHNRYKIAQKHGLPYEKKQIDFESEAAAEVWIIKTQFGRRNLTMYQRSELAIKLRPLLAEHAKERMVRKPEFAMPNLAQQNYGATRDNLAELAGVGHSTIDKVAYIQEHGSDNTKTRLQSGAISIHKAYGETTHIAPPKKRGRPAETAEQKQIKAARPISTATEKTCSICGRTLPVEKFYTCNGAPKGPCRQCSQAERSYGNSPAIRDNIQMLVEISKDLTDTEKTVEYTIEDVIATITEEVNRLIRIVATEMQNHADLIKNPGNKEALQKALARGVSQIQETIKNLAR